MVMLVGQDVFRIYRLSMKQFIMNLVFEYWFVW